MFGREVLQMNEKITKKDAWIIGLLKSLDLDMIPDRKITLFTSSGMVCGRCNQINEESIKDITKENILRFTTKTLNDALEERNDIQGTNVCILLTDVTVYISNTPIFLPELVVFSDQINGFSYGSIEIS